MAMGIIISFHIFTGVIGVLASVAALILSSRHNDDIVIAHN